MKDHSINHKKWDLSPSSLKDEFVRFEHTTNDKNSVGTPEEIKSIIVFLLTVIKHM